MSDDPRLSKLITKGEEGDIVIVGAPFDFFRKRSINKGGEDNGPCCLRRFYPKVGPLINPEYQIDISSLKVTDFGNIFIQISEEEEKQKFVNVKTRKFKGEYVNYEKQSPQKIIVRMADLFQGFMGRQQLPFIFGGSKECVLASASAFFERQKNPEACFFLLSGNPFLNPPYDGDKGDSGNILTILNQKYPNRKIHVFGPQIDYFPSKYIKYQKQKQINLESLPNISITLLSQIRKLKVKDRKLFERTQGCKKMIEIFNKETPVFVNITVQVMALFVGCRDIHHVGLQIEQMLQIMAFFGRMKNIRGVSISQFNPSCQDYESSLKILNLFYYYLLGRARND